MPNLISLICVGYFYNLLLTISNTFYTFLAVYTCVFMPCCFFNKPAHALHPESLRRRSCLEGKNVWWRGTLASSVWSDNAINKPDPRDTHWNCFHFIYRENIFRQICFLCVWTSFFKKTPAEALLNGGQRRLSADGAGWAWSALAVPPAPHPVTCHPQCAVALLRLKAKEGHAQILCTSFHGMTILWVNLLRVKSYFLLSYF